MKKRDSNTWYLLKTLTKADIKQKYQGSVLGILWSLIVPLMMLAIYTFVFSEIFKTKWEIDTSNKFQFALMLFCGLSIYNMFADVLGRSVGLIVSNQNYVKKVVFPLELLPLVITFSALFNCVISFLVLIVANTILGGTLYLTTLYTPLILLPHVLFCAGIAYLLSAISVYLRDMASFVSVLTMIFMYLTPVFFSLSAIPEAFRKVMMFNAMTYAIENMRNVIIYGISVNWGYFGISCIVSAALFALGWWVFRRVKDGFADLL